MTARTLTQARLGMLGWILLPIGILALGYGACVGLSGCTPTFDQQTMVAAYGADQLECVQIATSRDQAESCVAAVRTYWCGPNGPLRQAGACAYVPAADGGTHP